MSHFVLGPLPNDLPMDFSISRVGVNYTQIRNVSLGEDLHIENIGLTYRMDTKDIVRVEKVVVSGLHALFHLDEQKRIRICGFSFPEEKKKDHSNPVFDLCALESYFAYLPGRVILKNSTLFIDDGKNRLCIPVKAGVTLNRESLLADMVLTLFFMNQKITLGATADVRKRSVQMNISADTPCPSMLSSLVPGAGQVLNKFYGPLNGTVKTTDFSNFHFELNNLGVEPDPRLKLKFPKISGVLSVDHTATVLNAAGPVQIKLPGIDWGEGRFDISSQFTSNAAPRFSLTLQSKKNRIWTIAPELMVLPPGFFAGPCDQVQVFDPDIRFFVSGDLEHQTGGMVFSGEKLKCTKNDKDRLTDLADISGILVKTDIDGNFFGVPDDLKHLKLDARIDKIAIEQDGMEMNAFSLNASSDLAFKIINSGIVLKNANALIKSGPVHLKQEDTSADICELNIETIVKEGADGQDQVPGQDLVLSVNAVCNKTKIVSKQVTAFVKQAGITGNIEKLAWPGIRFQLKPWLSDADITLKDKGIQAKGIHFELPVTYPFKKKKTPGLAGIKKLKLHKKIAPAVLAKVVQTSQFAMDVSGKVTHTGFAGLAIDFSAHTGLDSAMNPFAKGHITTNKFSITQDSLTRFVPGISIDDEFNFDLFARADFSYINQKVISKADLQVANGTLTSVESGFSASGISADMHFNDLLCPETLPGQYINIGAFNAGRFNFNNGKVRFSIEDGRSINVENLKFNWCNGIVSTEAFRLPSDDNAIHLTLYCDRLEMEDLFHQLGAFDAEGGGTLSGRIPVVLKDSEIGFQNGFLFSTPGQGGRIFISSLDRMLVGIPKDTPEFAQLDLAGEALKNFEYNWVTFKLNTHGDTLAVNMQLDGKPAATLPFEYKRNLNSFVRVNAQSPGSNFQGIKLDLNLTLPFNQVIHFGSNLKHIMNP